MVHYVQSDHLAACMRYRGSDNNNRVQMMRCRNGTGYYTNASKSSHVWIWKGAACSGHPGFYQRDSIHVFSSHWSMHLNPNDTLTRKRCHAIGCTLHWRSEWHRTSCNVGIHPSLCLSQQVHLRHGTPCARNVCNCAQCIPCRIANRSCTRQVR